MEIIVIIYRFLLTFVLSLLFGLERQKSHKPIGFGTYIFVAVGSCALSIAAVTIQPDNPLPLLGAIITGIGFLGAGALIKTTDKIFGFTSAASIWIFAIFGLLIGIGEYNVGILTYALIWVIVVFDRYFQRRGIGSYQKKLEFSTNRIINQREVRELLGEQTKEFKLVSIKIDKKENKMFFNYLIGGSLEDLNKVPQRFYEREWCDSCKVE